jgi:hypothetical protein
MKGKVASEKIQWANPTEKRAIPSILSKQKELPTNGTVNIKQRSSE